MQWKRHKLCKTRKSPIIGKSAVVVIMQQPSYMDDCHTSARQHVIYLFKKKLALRQTKSQSRGGGEGGEKLHITEASASGTPE